MLKIYGSKLCPDCVNCLEELDAAGIAYVYHDFAENLLYLKEFLHLRDTSDVFADAKREGYIGIPCIVDEDGNVLLHWQNYVSQE